MRKSSLFLSIAAIAAAPLCAGAALASDLATHKADPAFAPSTAVSWSGCYVGAHAGFAVGQSQWNGGSVSDFGTDGAVGGGQAGCNAQFGGFVIGGEAELWGAGLDGSARNSINGGHVYRTRSDFGGDLALRGGFAVDRALLFAKVGVAEAQYRYGETWLLAGETSAGSGVYAGLLLGAGLEYALDAHWSVKGEYDYVNFGSKSGQMMSAGVPVVGCCTFKNDANIAKIGANYRF